MTLHLPFPCQILKVEVLVAHHLFRKEYYQCIQRLNEIGNTKGIKGDFNMNDYIDFNGVRAAMKANLHMAKVGLDRINKQVNKD